ncbi:MAG: hypothetical protein D4R84_00965 [Rhodocyclaceae bacterium]|nr:MAG: hypothetical protein D4R84_00965 [Rhodocyclaceae bacterium]
MYDLSARISSYNKMHQVFSKYEVRGLNESSLDALKQDALKAWPRYQELEGPAKTMSEVQTLPDPCASVRKAF